MKINTFYQMILMTIYFQKKLQKCEENAVSKPSISEKIKELHRKNKEKKLIS